MAKLTKLNLFKATDTRPETAMEKTTRVVRQMVDDDAEKRQAKITRLRTARLEKEANTLPETKPKAARKARRS